MLLINSDSWFIGRAIMRIMFHGKKFADAISRSSHILKFRCWLSVPLMTTWLYCAFLTIRYLVCYPLIPHLAEFSVHALRFDRGKNQWITPSESSWISHTALSVWTIKGFEKKNYYIMSSWSPAGRTLYNVSFLVFYAREDGERYLCCMIAHELAGAHWGRNKELLRPVVSLILYTS